MRTTAVFRTALLLVALLTHSNLGAAGGVLEYGPAASAGMEDAILKESLDLYRKAVGSGEIKGAVLLVARHGVIVLHEAVGWKHEAYRLPMEKDTLFRLASNTKPVVATAALLLKERRRLELQDPVARYLDSFANWKSGKITVFQLLTHSSGFRIQPIFYPFEKTPGAPPTLRLAVDKFGAEGPEVEPGTSYSYSNAGFNTLGAVIEAVSGQPLETFLKENIYDPLGMADTLNHEDPSKLYRMATVYRKDEDGEYRQGYTPGDPSDFPVIRASGGVISSAFDYGKFLQMYLQKGRYGNVRLLSEESIREATAPLVAVDDKDFYGLGWSVSPSDGTYGHSGSDGTAAWVDPARDLIGIVFTQTPGAKNPFEDFKKLVEASCQFDKP